MADPAVPFTLTDDVRDELNKLIGPAVNSVLTARMGSIEKKLLASMGDTLSKTLEDKLKDFKPAEPVEPTGGGGKKEKNVELETLKSRFNELQTQFSQSSEALAAERQKNRSSALKTTVNEQLGSVAKLEGVAARMAFSALIAEGRIGYDDSGEDPDKVVFRQEDGNTVDLAIGLRSWMKSDEFKVFAPAARPHGSGSRGGGMPPGGNGALTQEQRVSMLGDLLDKNL